MTEKHDAALAGGEPSGRPALFIDGDELAGTLEELGPCTICGTLPGLHLDIADGHITWEAVSPHLDDCPALVDYDAELQKLVDGKEGTE